MTICIDFDGTCVTHEYPRIGRDIGAIPILKQLVEAGHKLVLFTMRSRIELDQAVTWFNDNDITLYGINQNPTQVHWTSSPKAYGNLYIDDAALGCPLLPPKDHTERSYVDWTVIKVMLIEIGVLPGE